MTPRFREALQSGMLDTIKRAHPGTTDTEIAGIAGVDRSLVSRWRNGEREIGLTEIVRLQRHYGAEAALSPIAALDCCDVRRREAEPSPLRRGSLSVVQAASMMASEIEACLEDGLIDREEAGRLHQIAEGVYTKLACLRAAIREGRAA